MIGYVRKWVCELRLGNERLGWWLKAETTHRLQHVTYGLRRVEKDVIVRVFRVKWNDPRLPDPSKALWEETFTNKAICVIRYYHFMTWSWTWSPDAGQFTSCSELRSAVNESSRAWTNLYLRPTTEMMLRAVTIYNAYFLACSSWNRQWWRKQVLLRRVAKSIQPCEPLASLRSRFYTTLLKFSMLYRWATKTKT